MALIQPTTQLSDVIKQEPSIIPVINRFGIYLGTGDNSIEAICAEKNLDTTFLLTILNTFTNEEYFPEKHLKTFNPLTIVDYLRLTDQSYLKFQLPNIERHFASLLQHSGPGNNLKLMKAFFDEVKKDVMAFIETDLNNWFNAIETGRNQHNRLTAPSDGTLIEEKISDLRNMMIMHLHGDYDPNLCYAVIVAIMAFERDFRQNNRIRNRILRPLYQKSINPSSQKG